MLATTAKPVHVAVTRKVKPGCEASFEKAILTFFAASQKDEATLGAQLLRPLPNTQDRTYGILRSFENEADRDAFYQSSRFTQWQEAVASLVEDEYTRRNLDGLEAFFNDPNQIVTPPLWKMAIVTWLGVWPTVFVVTSLGGKWLLSGWPFWLAAGIETFFVVAILTWVVMPRLTRWLSAFLMPSAGGSPDERKRQ